MPRSMTGYGRAESSSSLGRLVVEMQSVNRKFLETTIFSPKEISRFDVEIRKRIAKSIFRGQVTIRLHLYPDDKSFAANLAMLKLLKKKWDGIAKELKLAKEDVDLAFLVQQSKSFSQIEALKGVELFKKSLLQCLEKALVEMIKMKNTEGKTLAVDLKKRLLKIEKDLEKIAKKAPEASSRYQEKLQEKLDSIIGKLEENEDRALKEAVVYAEKIDITEEIIRFRSHLKQLKALFVSKELPLRRKMDFITQEIMREINTIAAKSSDATISTLVVEIKSELEKVREQIQNIE